MIVAIRVLEVIVIIDQSRDAVSCLAKIAKASRGCCVRVWLSVQVFKCSPGFNPHELSNRPTKISDSQGKDTLFFSIISLLLYCRKLSSLLINQLPWLDVQALFLFFPRPPGVSSS